MTFRPEDYYIKVQGKDYLEVKWRVVWFRQDHPLGDISTEMIHHNGMILAFKATVLDKDGNSLANGHATYNEFIKGGDDKGIEKAETVAAGRALALAGYGTQFAGEDINEGDHLADSPVNSISRNAGNTNGASQNSNAYETASKNGNGNSSQSKFWTAVASMLKPVDPSSENVKANGEHLGDKYKEIQIAIAKRDCSSVVRQLFRFYAKQIHGFGDIELEQAIQQPLIDNFETNATKVKTAWGLVVKHAENQHA